MNTEIVIIFFHSPMGWPDAIFASAIVVAVGAASAAFIWKLLTIEE